MEGIVANLKMKAASVRDGVGGFGSSAQGGSMSPEPYVDAFSRRHQPSSRDLLRELKNTVYACVQINAFTCASFPPIVYYKSSPGLPMPKSMRGEPLDWLKKKSLERYPWWRIATKASPDQMALPFHPIMDLFQRGNWRHSGINLWYVTHQFLEVFGCAYWWIVRDPIMGLPAEIRVLPTQDVECKYETNGYASDDPWEQTKPTYYKVTLSTGYRHRQIDLAPEDIIEFHLPDLNNIFEGGRAPMHGGYEYAVLQGEYIAHRLALWKNRARPDFIVSPGNNEYLGPDERERLKKEWMQTFRRGGVGLPHFSATPLNVQLLQALESQVTLLAEHGATKEDILNSFGVPVSYFTRETNMANLAASRELHTSLTIRPRNHMRDEILTKRLCPFYDITGALFCSSEDPVPEDLEAKARRQEMDLKSGKRSINECRHEDGMPPVEWGVLPWIETYKAPADMTYIWEVRQQIAESRNDPAEEVEAARTRDRPEDVNDPNKPMSDYSHASAHGPEQKANERRKKEKQRAQEKKDDSETKKKAYADAQTPVVNNWHLPPHVPPQVIVNVPELKTPEIKVEVAAPTVNYEPPDVHVDVAAPQVSVAAPDVNVAPPKVEVTNQVPQPERKPRVRKARWKDEDGKEHEIVIEG